MEEQLADRGFVRIRRSRLENRYRVRGLTSNPSGDFTVTLDDGRQITGGGWQALVLARCAARAGGYPAGVS